MIYNFFILFLTENNEDAENFALTYVIKDEKMQLFIDYFENNERIIDINVQDQNRNIFLILYVKEGINKIVKFLLGKGITINIQNDEGNTTLHYSLSSKNLKWLKSLENMVLQKIEKIN